MPAPESHLQTAEQVRQPASFTPTKTWTDTHYIYRYDPECRVAKRTPLHDGAGIGGYFRMVENLAVQPESIARRPQLDPQRKPGTPKLRQAPLRAPFGSQRHRWGVLMTGICGLVFVVAAVVFIYPLVPGLQYALSHHPDSQVTQLAQARSVKLSQTNRVIIPKIGVDTAIVEGPDLDVLNDTDGVWHQTGDIRGNLVLAGHRFKYLPPNNATLYNLDKLQVGDAIIVDWSGSRYVYTVTKSLTVPAAQVSILNDTGQPQLTMYSCSDKRETGRVVVVATPLPQN